MADSDDRMDISTEKKEEEIDLTGDKGVLKLRLKEGDGWETPKDGDDVTVHYTGKLLDGTVFDSSVERGTPFSFKLGRHQVIKGWEEAVQSMKKGEKARFTMSPKYAYGEAGSPPKIPPNATLIFEIELISWSSEKDITKNRDGTIMKRVLKEGEGWERPKVDSKVKVRVRGYELEAVEPEVKYGAQFEEREVEFIVGAGDPNVSKVLERIVKDMKKGELCRARVAPSLAPSEHAGQHGVAYEVELLEFVKEKETWEMTNQEKLSACVTSREKGNALFKEGQYKRAAKRYKHAINCVSSDYSMTNEEKAKAKELKLPCHLNMAACFLKMERWKEVIEQTNKALEIDSSNPKALFRRALAHQGDHDLALKDLEKAKEKLPNDPEIAREIARCRRAIAEQEKKDRQLYTKMFASGLFDDEPPKAGKDKEKERQEPTPMEGVTVGGEANAS